MRKTRTADRVIVLDYRKRTISLWENYREIEELSKARVERELDELHARHLALQRGDDQNGTNGTLAGGLLR